jgi:hypothetical protein
MFNTAEDTMSFCDKKSKPCGITAANSFGPEIMQEYLESIVQKHRASLDDLRNGIFHVKWKSMESFVEFSLESLNIGADKDVGFLRVVRGSNDEIIGVKTTKSIPENTAFLIALGEFTIDDSHRSFPVEKTQYSLTFDDDSKCNIAKYIGSSVGTGSPYNTRFEWTSNVLFAISTRAIAAGSTLTANFTFPKERRVKRGSATTPRSAPTSVESDETAEDAANALLNLAASPSKSARTERESDDSGGALTRAQLLELVAYQADEIRHLRSELKKHKTGNA